MRKADVVDEVGAADVAPVVGGKKWIRERVVQCLGRQPDSPEVDELLMWQRHKRKLPQHPTSASQVLVITSSELLRNRLLDLGPKRAVGIFVGGAP